MWRDKTLLVIGAGTSFEIGFPLGKDLKQKISQLMAWDLDDFHRPKYNRDNSGIFRELERKYKDHFRIILNAARQISGGIGFASSVDNF